MDEGEHQVSAWKEAQRRSLRSAPPKLLIVFLVLAAYFGLYGLDAAKKRFSTPIEVTDSTLDSLNRHFANNQLTGGIPQQSIETLWGDVSRIKYRKFKDQDELIEALKADLFVEKAFKMRSVEKAQEKLSHDYIQAQLQLEMKRKAENERLTKLENTKASDLKDVEEDKLRDIGSMREEQLKALRTLADNSQLSPGRQSLAQVRIERTIKHLADNIVIAAESRKNEIEERFKKELAGYHRDHEKNLRQIDADLNSSRADFNHQVSVLNNDMRALDADADLRISMVYRQLGPRLPEISPKAPIVAEPSVNAFLESALDEQNNLHVIYQIFRISCIIILIFSVVFVIAMLLRTLPYSGSADLLIEQAKGLLTRGDSSIPGAMKAAVVSVAALGVGTAAIAAGVVINEKADRALDSSSTSSVYSSTSGFSKSTLRFVSKEIREQIERQQDGDRPISINMPTPSVVVGPAMVRVIPVGFSSNNTEVATSIAALSTRVGELKDELSRIRTDAQKFDEKIWTKIQPEVKKLDDQLSGIKDLLKGVPGDLQIANVHLTDIQKTLVEVKTEVEQIRKASLGQPPPPEGRNIFNRASQLFGGESYAISVSSYNSLATFLQLPKDQIVKNALKEMQGEAPADKETFLKTLNAKIAAEKKKPENKPLLELLAEQDDPLKRSKLWESLILRFARLPR